MIDKIKVLQVEHVEQMGEHGAKWLRSKYAIWVLAAISFTESLFAPILIDPFLIALILAKRELWVRYVAVAVIFSVLGGMAGYALGLLFFDTIGIWLVEFFRIKPTFDQIAAQLSANGFAFVLLGAVTPIPYKVVALASGFVEVGWGTFIFASIFGRIMRLALVGYAAYAVGPHALPIIRKHLLTLAYIFGVILILYIITQLV